MPRSGPTESSAVSSPPTARSLDVIELLAKRPESTFRLTDVATHLGLTQATTLAILRTLCDRGWATRGADKAFSVGPALVRTADLADMARRSHAPDEVHAAVRELGRTFGCGASVSQRRGDSFVMRSYEDSAEDVVSTGDVRVLPFAAPFGTGIAAWEAPVVCQEWMLRSAHSKPGLQQRIRDLLTETRAQGFSVERMSPALTEAALMMAATPEREMTDAVRNVLERLVIEVADASYATSSRSSDPVTSVSAPVLDKSGRPVYSVAVHPFRPMAPAEASAIGHQVRDAAVRLGGVLAQK